MGNDSGQLRTVTAPVTDHMLRPLRLDVDIEIDAASTFTATELDRIAAFVQRHADRRVHLRHRGQVRIPASAELAFLAQLPTITRVVLWVSTRAMAWLPNVLHLELWDARTLDGLSHHARLRTLSINQSRLDDLRVLATLPSLVELTSTTSHLGDVSALGDCLALQRLQIAGYEPPPTKRIGLLNSAAGDDPALPRYWVGLPDLEKLEQLRAIRIDGARVGFEPGKELLAAWSAPRLATLGLEFSLLGAQKPALDALIQDVPLARHPTLDTMYVGYVDARFASYFGVPLVEDAHALTDEESEAHRRRSIRCVQEERSMRAMQRRINQVLTSRSERSKVKYAANAWNADGLPEDNLDAIAIAGSCRLVSDARGPKGATYRSALLQSPSWLDVATCANAMLLVTKPPGEHCFLEGVRLDAHVDGVDEYTFDIGS